MTCSFVFISMSKIIKDIVDDLMEDVEIKPNKSKLVIKWTVRISILAIVAAFIIGQFRITYLNKFTNIENNIIKLEKNDLRLESKDSEITKKVEDLETEVKKNSERIDRNTDRIIEKLK